MEKDNRKIITVCFVLAAGVAVLTVEVLLKALAVSFPVIARFRSLDVVSHGLPLVIGFGLFAALQFNKKVWVWADEVVVEVRKVVWPTRKDTFAMTMVCCVMLVVSGVCFGIFDFLAGSLVKILVNS